MHTTRCSNDVDAPIFMHNLVCAQVCATPSVPGFCSPCNAECCAPVHRLLQCMQYFVPWPKCVNSHTRRWGSKQSNALANRQLSHMLLVDLASNRQVWTATMPLCSVCGSDTPLSSFSKSQQHKASGVRKCKACSAVADEAGGGTSSTSHAHAHAQSDGAGHSHGAAPAAAAGTAGVPTTQSNSRANRGAAAAAAGVPAGGGANLGSMAAMVVAMTLSHATTSRYAACREARLGREAVADTQGFAWIGKLTSRSRHLKALLGAAMSSLLDDSNMCSTFDPFVPWEEYSEASVWGRLSLHLRLHLVAELAIGLFVPGEPLPKNDAIHVVAFMTLLRCVGRRTRRMHST